MAPCLGLDKTLRAAAVWGRPWGQSTGTPTHTPPPPPPFCLEGSSGAPRGSKEGGTRPGLGQDAEQQALRGLGLGLGTSFGGREPQERKAEKGGAGRRAGWLAFPHLRLRRR